MTKLRLVVWTQLHARRATADTRWARAHLSCASCKCSFSLQFKCCSSRVSKNEKTVRLSTAWVSTFSSWIFEGTKTHAGLKAWSSILILSSSLCWQYWTAGFTQVYPYTVNCCSIIALPALSSFATAFRLGEMAMFTLAMSAETVSSRKWANLFSGEAVRRNTCTTFTLYTRGSFN